MSNTVPKAKNNFYLFGFLAIAKNTGRAKANYESSIEVQYPCSGTYRKIYKRLYYRKSKLGYLNQEGIEVKG